MKPNSKTANTEPNESAGNRLVSLARNFTYAEAALVLRVGLGLVFVTGGAWKLARLLSPEASAGMVEKYMSAKGYINAFFAEYLFTGPMGNVLDPWSFLTILSSFELVSGVCLILGLFVCGLSVLYGFLLWSFVIALPVVTITPFGDAPSHFSPAMLVQARDIALSGMMFALFMMGSGSNSLDTRVFGNHAKTHVSMDWEATGLLLRLCLAVPFLVGGFFAGFDSIKTFSLPAAFLIGAGLLLAIGAGIRWVAGLLLLGLLYYMASKLTLESSLLDNMNAIKREFALVAGLAVLALLGGGGRFTWRGLDRLVHPPKDENG